MTFLIRRTLNPTSSMGRHGSSTRRLTLLAMIGALAVATLGLPGCGARGRPRAIVTGRVTYNGKPLQFGTVILEPEMGQYATGLIQPDGTFEMETRGEGRGAPVGKCKVRFVCFASQDPAATPGKATDNATQGEALGLGASLIPEKYLSSATSGITVDVKPDYNEPLVFALTDP